MCWRVEGHAGLMHGWERRGACGAGAMGWGKRRIVQGFTAHSFVSLFCLLREPLPPKDLIRPDYILPVVLFFLSFQMDTALTSRSFLSVCLSCCVLHQSGSVSKCATAPKNRIFRNSSRPMVPSSSALHSELSINRAAVLQ